MSPSIGNDAAGSPSPRSDVVETREVSSGLGSAVSDEEKVAASRGSERDVEFVIPTPSVPKQRDEFQPILTKTERGELSETASAAVPTVPGHSDALVSTLVSVEPSERTEKLSNSRIAAASDRDGLPSRQTLTKSREDLITNVKPATANEKDLVSVNLKPTRARATGDMVTTSGETGPTGLEKAFATYGLPGRGQKYESGATASLGYKVAWKRTAMSIGSFENYLAIVALVVFVASLFTYWFQPFAADVSGDAEAAVQDSQVAGQESDVAAQDSVDTKLGSGPETTVAENNPGTKQGGGIEWQSASLLSSGDRSLNGRGQGSTTENSLPNSASVPSRLAPAGTSEPNQADSEKALPTKKQVKADKRKVTVEDLITDKKKVTVDDLINDN